jgi:hypothetical protein
MTNDILPTPGEGREVGERADAIREVGKPQEVPAYLDILPESGREVVVIGDPERFKELNHLQGDNSFGFQGTCGLVSCEDVLRQFGVEVTEDEVVAFAALFGLCHVGDNPAYCGGTTEFTQAVLLSTLGVPAHMEGGRGLSDLAGWVSEDRGVIIEVNAGELWNDVNAYGNGEANHAIVVTGVALDPVDGRVAGFYINDSGRGYPGDSGRFVTADLMERAWVAPGGSGVITDVVRGR